jgi:hypothetical protein
LNNEAVLRQMAKLMQLQFHAELKEISILNFLFFFFLIFYEKKGKKRKWLRIVFYLGEMFSWTEESFLKELIFSCPYS